MKTKHNKKRNTAFLYETLMVELTKSTLSENNEAKETIIEILSTHFQNESVLSQDLNMYRSLYETQGVDPRTAEKLIAEVRYSRDRNIDNRKLFNEQTALINMINKRLSKQVYSNFVPGYKTMATISQLFNQNIMPKHRVLLEKELMEFLTREETKENNKKLMQIDNLVYKTFATKFNEKYGDSLLSEQKDLLSKYIMSFEDNGVSLKMTIADELNRIGTQLREVYENTEILSDEDMILATKKVEKMVERFKSEPISESMLKNVLKMQKLIHEIRE